MRMPLRLSLRPPNLAVPSLLSDVGLLLRCGAGMRDRVFSGPFEKGKQKGGGKAARARGAPNRKNSLHVYPHFQYKVHNSNF